MFQLRQNFVWLRPVRFPLPFLTCRSVHAFCGAESKGDTLKRMKGEWGETLQRGGEACQQSTILDGSASRRTHGNAPDQLRSVTEPLRETRASLRCCPFVQLFILPRFMRAERGVSRRDRVRTECRAWAPGRTPSRWRRWSGNPVRGWKCQRGPDRVQMETLMAPVRREDVWKIKIHF